MKTINYTHKSAKELAGNKEEWRVYFEIIATYYLESFFDNLKILEKWIEKLHVEKDNYEKIQDNSVLFKEIMSYFKAYKALLLKENEPIQVDEFLIKKFKKINNNRKNKNVSTKLGLKNYKIANGEFSLRQLMDMMIDFYKDFDVRLRFFEQLIQETNKKERLVELRNSFSFENNLYENKKTAKAVFFLRLVRDKRVELLRRRR